jgi:biopolymer transport protein ExbD
MGPRRFHTRLPRARIELLPLLDVIFLLLAVLLLSAARLVRSYALPVELPRASSGVSESPRALLLLSVLPDGGYALAGEPRPLAEIESLVAERLAADPELALLVQAAAAAQHRAVAGLLDRLRAVGAGRVLLLAQPEGEPGP